MYQMSGVMSLMSFNLVPFGVYMMHSHTSSLAELYAISSGITFVLFWLGTVLLLQSYRKRLGTIKFWIIMLVPLLYFLSQFQPLVTSILLNYSSGNPMLFSTVYVLMLEVSTPIGGLLFGLAFMLVALRIQNAMVKGYLVISGIGLLLLLISYRPQEIISGPFPPFGILSASFMGLASYLIFFGIYSSAILYPKIPNFEHLSGNQLKLKLTSLETLVAQKLLIH